jgi:hypothetical protein
VALRDGFFFSGASVRKAIGLMLVLLLAACNLPRPGLDTLIPPATDTPAYRNCYFNWATQPLPDLSTQVQEALEKAGLDEVRVRAEAFGENCYDSQTNEVVRFAAMETDYHLTAQVADLKDAEALGNLLERMLVVLDRFPAGSTPGPQPGYVGVQFTSGGDVLNLWFQADAAHAARNEGLHGRFLLERLQQE